MRIHANPAIITAGIGLDPDEQFLATAQDGTIFTVTAIGLGAGPRLGDTVALSAYELAPAAEGEEPTLITHRAEMTLDAFQAADSRFPAAVVIAVNLAFARLTEVVDASEEAAAALRDLPAAVARIAEATR